MYKNHQRALPLYMQQHSRRASYGTAATLRSITPPQECYKVIESISNSTNAFVPWERLQLSSSHGLLNYCIKNVYEKTSAPKTYCKTCAIDSD